MFSIPELILSLFVGFIILIIFIPIILLVGFYLIITKQQKKLSETIKPFIQILKDIFPNSNSNKIAKNKSSRSEAKKNVEDAEYREV